MYVCMWNKQTKNNTFYNSRKEKKIMNKIFSTLEKKKKFFFFLEHFENPIWGKELWRRRKMGGVGGGG